MIKVESISKYYGKNTPNEVVALDRVSMTIEEGEFVVVIGVNGSGKSTLLNALAGTFICDGGRIMVDNTDVTKDPDFRRAKYIGRVFQNPYSGTAPTMTIAENLQMASLRGEQKGLKIGLTKERRAYLQEQLKALQMGLENRMDTPIGLLSGGQRQAVTLLMAAMQKPKILLLDEHTAALDPISAEQVLYITNDLIQRFNLTALMVTHSMSYAARFGTRVIMMNLGDIVCDIRGEEKRNLNEEALMQRFNERHIHIIY